MQTRIDKYWSQRAPEFSKFRLISLAGPEKARWLDLIKENLPVTNHKIRALDVGTGAGFFAFLLAELGCDVTAIDYSQDMVDQAMECAELLHYPPINFLRMDAQKLEFEDNSFDFIISRNVTWTIPDPGKAYGEWCRVLAPGGVILNNDANYGYVFKVFDESGETERQNQKWEQSKEKFIGTRPDMVCERNDIAKQLYKSNCERPQWDVDILIHNGISSVSIEMNIMDKIFPGISMKHPAFDIKWDEDPAAPSTKIFLIKAVKPNVIIS